MAYNWGVVRYYSLKKCEVIPQKAKLAFALALVNKGP